MVCSLSWLVLLHCYFVCNRCGELHHVVGLQTTEYLFREDQWAPWYAMDQSFSYVNLMLSETVSFGKYKVHLSAKYIYICVCVCILSSCRLSDVHKYHRESLLFAIVEIPAEPSQSYLHQSRLGRYSRRTHWDGVGATLVSCNNVHHLV